MLVKEAICWRPQQFGLGSVSPLGSRYTNKVVMLSDVLCVLLRRRCGGGYSYVMWVINDINFVSFMEGSNQSSGQTE